MGDYEDKCYLRKWCNWNQCIIFKHNEGTKCIKWTKCWVTIWPQLMPDFCFSSPGVLAFPVFPPYCWKCHQTLCKVCDLRFWTCWRSVGIQSVKAYKLDTRKEHEVFPYCFWSVAFRLFSGRLWGSKSSLIQLCNKHSCLHACRPTHIHTFTHTYVRIHKHPSVVN